MEDFGSPILTITFATGSFALVAFFAARFVKTSMKRSPDVVALAAIPALAMLGLFYSLAIHMHHSLDAWPASIGERGFPAPLLSHAEIAADYFVILAIIGIFVWPRTFLLCLIVRRWRGALYYLGVYALSCLVCFGIMMLAPTPFLNWWWD